MSTEKEIEPPDATRHSRRTLLGAGASAALSGAALAATASPALAAASGTGNLKVGAGKSAISIPDSLLPLDNFTTVHDDLYVRVLLLQNGDSFYGSPASTFGAVLLAILFFAKG